MLRTLRNRRRPRYGAQVCAILAAVLLLLSVSVLHSRLGFDRTTQVQSSSSRLGLGFPSNLDDSQDDDDIVVNPLVEDAETVTTTTTTTTAGSGSGTSNNGDDDRIDELDVVEDENDDQSRVSDEEQILRGVESEEDSDSDSDNNRSNNNNNNNKPSDYVWDHVVGVTRRAFNTRSVDPWEDSTTSGFDDFSLEDDPSKIAFGSDDQPVDENVRHKLDEIRVIEDALLLKASHGGASGVSPLREGWATWFEKKGDFLRRDRMFKSNLELLNPLNNPLLQDPDGVGLTSLTRGDKLMQKALLNEFRKLPFVVKKPYGVTKEPHESKLTGVGNGVRNGGAVKVEENVVGKKANEVKGVERRTLNDKKIVHASQVSKSIKLPTDTVREQRDDEQPARDNSVEGYEGHFYADGKRWGYFPGLQPHLSFSDFMDEFFKQGKCSMRVFMVWNSPPWMYSVRHQRGLESLLYHHPDACVTIFSETIELDFFKDFVKDGFKVAVAMPNLDELLKRTPAHLFASAWFEWRKTKFYSTHYSELIRLAALYKYGGLYLDSDIVVLKSLSSIGDFLSREDQVANSSFSAAAMGFTKHSPFVLECLKEYYSTYDETRLRWNGADLLTRVANHFGSRDNILRKQIEIKIQPSSISFPIGRQNISRYFTAPADDSERAEQDILFRKILNESIVFHFWNSLTSTLIPESESLAAKLLNHFCIRCLDVL